MVIVAGYNIPEGLYYSDEFAWARIEGDVVRVGITDYAQKFLQEICSADLPKSGTTTTYNVPYGSVESMKTAADLFAPLSGTVEEANQEILENPDIINKDPYGEGWIIVIRPTNLQEELEKLMTDEQGIAWYTVRANIS
ncbi:MAG: glycine cleavage system protein GcvH [Candidatus Thorarchaeota archaeon]|jgi:glycine cleavage system H protein